MAFLVKGESDQDAVAILRDPLSTRPLCMKNTDDEIIVSANCSALSHTLKKPHTGPKMGLLEVAIFSTTLLQLTHAVEYTP